MGFNYPTGNIFRSNVANLKHSKWYFIQNLGTNNHRLKVISGPLFLMTKKIAIDLNGPMQKLEMALLVVTLPLWAAIFPFFGFSSLFSFSGLVLVISSCYCAWYLTNCINNKLVFLETGVRLPGIKGGSIKYSDITRVIADKNVLVVEYIATVLRVKHIDIDSISETNATRLYRLLDEKISASKLSDEVCKILNRDQSS